MNLHFSLLVVFDNIVEQDLESQAIFGGNYLGDDGAPSNVGVTGVAASQSDGVVLNLGGDFEG